MELPEQSVEQAGEQLEDLVRLVEVREEAESKDDIAAKGGHNEAAEKVQNKAAEAEDADNSYIEAEEEEEAEHADYDTDC